MAGGGGNLFFRGGVDVAFVCFGSHFGLVLFCFSPEYPSSQYQTSQIP